MDAGHDSDMRSLFAAMRQLMGPPEAEREQRRKEMGFHVKEDSVPYR